MKTVLGVMVYSFSANTQDARQADLCESEVRLAYVVSCRPARAT